jgi:hypothetical protein
VAGSWICFFDGYPAGMNEEQKNDIVWLRKEVERLTELVELQKYKILQQKIAISSLKSQILDDGL